MRSLTVLALALMTILPTRLRAQDYTVVFEGRPLRKAESSFEETVTANLTAEESFEYSVRIVQRQGKYYWASRDMRELTRHEGGAYITFIAVDGAGYVRIGIPMMLATNAINCPKINARRRSGTWSTYLLGFHRSRTMATDSVRSDPVHPPPNKQGLPTPLRLSVAARARGARAALFWECAAGELRTLNSVRLRRIGAVRVLRR